tara:strand:+ start:1235 stop:1396 length:162 start_codon:yes stop_codon:yes gene_type:complete
MDFSEEDLNELTRKDLELIAQDLKSNIVPRFTKKRKYEIIIWILTFQKFFSNE